MLFGIRQPHIYWQMKRLNELCWRIHRTELPKIIEKWDIVIFGICQKLSFLIWEGLLDELNSHLMGIIRGHDDPADDAFR